MSDKERFDSHASFLGKIVGNLLSLEMGARMVIVKLDHHAAEQVHAQLPQVKTGDSVELNAFTNGDGLTQTLQRYNKRASPDCRITIAPIVRLRDAISHGRMFGFGPIKPLRLLKFGRKKGASGKVPVELAEDMTNEWFVENIHMLEEAIEKIRQALDYDKTELV